MKPKSNTLLWNRSNLIDILENPELFVHEWSFQKYQAMYPLHAEVMAEELVRCAPKVLKYSAIEYMMKRRNFRFMRMLRSDDEDWLVKKMTPDILLQIPRSDKQTSVFIDKYFDKLRSSKDIQEKVLIYEFLSRFEHNEVIHRNCMEAVKAGKVKNKQVLTALMECTMKQATEADIPALMVIYSNLKPKEREFFLNSIAVGLGISDWMTLMQMCFDITDIKALFDDIDDWQYSIDAGFIKKLKASMRTGKFSGEILHIIKDEVIRAIDARGFTTHGGTEEFLRRVSCTKVIATNLAERATDKIPVDRSEVNLLLSMLAFVGTDRDIEHEVNLAKTLDELLIILKADLDEYPNSLKRAIFNYHTQAIPGLCRIVADNTCESASFRAAELIGLLAENWPDACGEAIPILLNEAIGQREDETADMCMKTLAVFGQAAVEPVFKALAIYKDPDVGLTLMEFISMCPTEQGVSYLLERLESDEDRLLTQYIVEILRDTGAKLAIEPLYSMWKEETDSDMREVIAYSLRLLCALHRVSLPNHGEIIKMSAEMESIMENDR